MAKSYGILLQENNDLDIRVVRDAEGKIIGGLQLGHTTNQNIGIILKMHPGELKEHPFIGVGISNVLLGNDYLEYKHKIRQNLAADGMRVNRLEFSEKIIEIDANYKL